MGRRVSIRKRKQRRIAAGTIAVLVAVFLCAGIFMLVRRNTGGSSSLFLAYSFEASPVYSIETEDVTLFASSLCVVDGDSGADSSVTADAAITLNTTTLEVVYSDDAYEQLEPASITKLMTCLLALKYGDLEEEITVKSSMLENLDPASSVCGVTDGDTLTLEQLLYGLMLPSGNDAANVIAYLIAGDEQSFVDMMNAEAKLLGATDTSFANAHGLTDPDHYTTAYDIYLILNELLNYDKFLEIIGTSSYTATFININTGTEQTLEWESIIGYMNGVVEAPDRVTLIGGKSGTTPEAGCCLSLVSVNEDGETFISVVLGSESKADLYSSMNALLKKTTQ